MRFYDIIQAMVKCMRCVPKIYWTMRCVAVNVIARVKVLCINVHAKWKCFTYHVCRVCVCSSLKQSHDFVFIRMLLLDD